MQTCYRITCLKKVTVPYLFILGFWLSCSNSQAQPGFSQWYDFNSGASFHNVIHKEDTLIIIGSNVDLSANQWGALFVKMDTLGNIIDSKLHLDSLGGQFSFRKSYPLIATSDGGYLLGGDVLDRGSDFLLKLDQDGNKVFFKEYPYPSNVFFGLFSNVIELNDGFLIAGFRQLDNFKNDWYLFKIDLNGNTLWEKYYGEPGLNEFLGNFIQLNDNYFVLCGSKGLFSAPYNIDEDYTSGWIIGVDSLGEILWERQSENNVEWTISNIMSLPNGDWLYSTLGFEILYPEILGGIPKLIRRDADFNLIWEKELAPSSSSSNIVRTFQLAPDGNYIVASRWLMPQTIVPNDGVHYWLPACLTKISPEGDSIWSRCDTVPLPMNIKTWDHSYGGMVILPSGSTIAVGCFDQSTNPGKTWAWVVKVDKNGCLEELCATTDVEGFEKDKRIKVFPNPVNDMLYIDSQIAGSWSLYDVWGRDVKRILVDHQGFQCEVSVADLAPGVYYYNLSKDGLILGEGKVLVQR